MKTSAKYNRYAARIPKGVGVGGVVGSLSFNIQGWGGLGQFGRIRTDSKRGKGAAKIGHFCLMS